MDIVLFEVPEQMRPLYQRLEELGSHSVVYTEGALSEKNVGEYLNAEIISVFIESHVNTSVLRKLKHLKFVATRSTGYDHIDRTFCKENSISVSNVPMYGGCTVAEHAFGLILTISRKLYDSIRQPREGDFDRKNLVGFDLEGKTLGVIGIGDIGGHMARIAKGFGMKVLAHDIEEYPNFAKEIGFQYTSLKALLRDSDIITLNVPATTQTENLINEETIKSMKDGVILINTARGSIIDSAALVRGLRDGKIGAAGLDVLPAEKAFFTGGKLEGLSKSQNGCLENEALLLNHMLLKMPNVYFTPHNSYNTKEAMCRIVETSVGNITAFIQGKPINLA